MQANKIIKQQQIIKKQAIEDIKNIESIIVQEIAHEKQEKNVHWIDISLTPQTCIRLLNRRNFPGESPNSILKRLINNSSCEISYSYTKPSKYNNIRATERIYVTTDIRDTIKQLHKVNNIRYDEVVWRLIENAKKCKSK